jgi:hypothetical protein
MLALPHVRSEKADNGWWKGNVGPAADLGQIENPAVQQSPAHRDVLSLSRQPTRQGSSALVIVIGLPAERAPFDRNRRDFLTPEQTISTMNALQRQCDTFQITLAFGRKSHVSQIT